MPLTYSHPNQGANSLLVSSTVWHSLYGPILLALAMLLFLLEAWTPVQQIDDAFISYRYAQNLVDGWGLVFNPGDPVEGYTNLSWTLLVAAAMALGMDALMAGHWLGLVSGALLLILSYGYAVFLLPLRARPLAGLAPLALLASNSFASWTPSGLETPLFAACVVGAVLAHGRQRLGQVLAWSILASLTRPEGVLLAGLLLGGDWLWRVWHERPRQLGSLLQLSWPALGFALYLLLHTAVRLYYYHDYVPNTFHAKVGGLPLDYGSLYLYRMLIDGPGLLLLPALLAAWKVPAYRLSFSFVVLIGLYSVLVGGDVFKLGRFFLPVLPLLIAGALLGVWLLWQRRPWLGVLLGLSLPASMWVALYVSWPNNPDFSDLPGQAWPHSWSSAKRSSARSHVFYLSTAQTRQQVESIGAFEPRIRRVATVAIGMVGFYGKQLEIVDMVGLTDRHIARSETRIANAVLLPGHQRTDANYVLGKKPELLLIPRVDMAIAEWSLPALLELWQNPRLATDYEWNPQLHGYLLKPGLWR